MKRRAGIAEVSGESERLEDRTLLVPSLSVQDFSYVEGDSFDQNPYDGFHNLVITLSEAPVAGFTINLQTLGGTALPNSPWWDYADSVSAVSVLAGQTQVYVAVRFRGDTTPEPNETYSLKITSVSPTSAATIADDTGVITILNDDGPVIPTIAIGDQSLYEGNSGTTTVTFPLTLSEPTSVPVSVNYVTSDYSTTAGVDYVTTSGTVTFAPGTTSQTLTVVVNGDTDVESTEAFFVDLNNPVNGILLSNQNGPEDGQAVGTIGNDDSPPPIGVVSLVATKPNAAEQATEGDGTLTKVIPGEFTFALNQPLPHALTIDFSVTGSASQGQDFSLSQASSVTFPIGTTKVTVDVSPIVDALTESPETVVLAITGGSHLFGTQANHTTATVTIRDRGLVVLRAEDGDNKQTYSFTEVDPKSWTVGDSV